MNDPKLPKPPQPLAPFDLGVQSDLARLTDMVMTQSPAQQDKTIADVGEGMRSRALTSKKVVERTK